MLYLRLGSLLLFLTFVASCKGKVDALVEADWVFVNNSTHKIEIVAKDFNSFTIMSGESYTYNESGDGLPNMTPNEYISPYYAGSKLLIDDIDEYTLVKGEGITSVANYVNYKVRENYYIFTYVFTDELIDSW
jgi:hypothetical protein